MDWIFNLEKIREDHNDIADYERFFVFYKCYIENHKDEHDEIQRVLIKCLCFFKNETLISISYRLLNEIDLPFSFDILLLEKHFSNPRLKQQVLEIAEKLKLSFTEDFLYKSLYDPNFEDPYIYKYFKDRKEVMIEFLNIKDDNLVRKQLTAMSHTEIFVNIDYYLPFIGSEDRSICFLIYEVMCIMIDKKIDISFSHTKNKIPVESISNFLIYALPFLRERYELMRYINEKNIEKIEPILFRYVSSNSKLRISNNKNIYSTEFKIRKPPRLEFEVEEEPDFSFLFSGDNYKAVIDCIEL